MFWHILLTLGVVALYHFIRRQYTHWERHGIPHETPKIPFGSLSQVRHGERSFGLVMYDIYMRSKGQILGIYLLFRPAILVRDAELVRKMMTSDFASFHDRGVYVDEEHDILSSNLFSLRGQSWKTLRTKLTPSFSSGKIKGMFTTIDDVAEKMVQHLNITAGNDPGGVLIEMKSVLTTYAVDIIGSVIFGLDIDSYSNPENEFRMISNKLFETDGFLQNLLGITSFICPPITTLLRRLGVTDPTRELLRDIMQRTIEFREKNRVVRKDLLQLLIQLRNTGKISDDDDKNWDIETAAENLKSMSIDMIAAQAFLFYIAGSETTAATSAFTLYELAMSPDLLRKAQTEVEECLRKHNLKPTDKLTYEAVQDMKFLDLCIMETTRKYPGLPFLNRECTQDYQIPNTDYKIAKGTPIIISLFGIHRDPEHFPNPLKYDPERFLPDVMNYNPVAYIPFGEGPRHCIALRMGKINAKVALVKILANFDIIPIEHKEVEFIFHVAPVLIPKDGLNVRLVKKTNLA